MNTNALTLEHISLRRGGFTALSDVSWQAPRGGCCAVLGPNGAGKSTLLAVLTGHEWPTAGSVTVLGERYGDVDLAHHRRRIGFVGQSRMPHFVQYQTAFETVLAGRWGTLIVPPQREPTEEDLAATRHELEMVGLLHRAETEFARLSSGEQMRLALARALVSHPELLILDEPTAALDLGARANFVRALEQLLQARGDRITVLLVTHYVEDLPGDVSSVLLLRQGQVVAAGPAETTLTSAHLSDTFGCEVEVHRHDGHYTAQARPAGDWIFS
jgi:iron complex transport system ATP-binding protein